MRYVRSFLLALTTLAFFLLVLVAGVYVFITPERVSARLANTLSHHLGLKIEMAKLHIDTRLPSLKFTVKDAVLTCADGAVRGSVPSATIRLHPLALFTRSPRISEITTADGSLTFGNTSPKEPEEVLTVWRLFRLPISLPRAITALPCMYGVLRG